MLQRYRLTFAKTMAMRFTSHLDTQRAIERTMRRAKIPLAYSEGFTPHAKLQLAAALPLGYISIGELAECWLTREFCAEEMLSALNQYRPPGLVFTQCSLIPLEGKSLQTRIYLAVYICYLQQTNSPLRKKIDELLCSQSILRQRRGKEYDLRPLIHSIELTPHTREEFLHKKLLDEVSFSTISQKLTIYLNQTEGASGRPDEVLDVLGIPLHKALIMRERMLFNE